MKDFFKLEDFNGPGGVIPEIAEIILYIANKKLNELIESWPKAYGYRCPAGYYVASSRKDSITTEYTARIAFITKEPCKHEPNTLFVHTVNNCIPLNEAHKLLQARCLHCGIELKATWSEKNA